MHSVHGAVCVHSVHVTMFVSVHCVHRACVFSVHRTVCVHSVHVAMCVCVHSVHRAVFV